MAGPLENSEASLAPPKTWFRDRLSLEECQGVLAASQMGRVGAIVNGRPVIVPAAYASDGPRLLVRIDGDFLDEAMHRVAFEVEAVDARTGTGWSVVVQGAATEVTDEQEIRELELSPAAAGATSRPTRWIHIRPGHIIGRRLPGVAEGGTAA